MRFDEIVKNILESSDYRGEHQAPTKGEGSAPLWNLTEIYPDDIYSSKAVQYYGDASPLDSQAILVMHSYRNRPNAKVVIYRAVPKIESREDIIDRLEYEKSEILRRADKNPKIKKSMDKAGFYNVSKYFDYIHNELEKIKNSPQIEEQKIDINRGDWITTVRGYAVEHGEGTLLGNYKILKKTVFARDVFTDANSIFEFGYDPQPVVK